MNNGRCTCYVRGAYDEKPRKRLLPHRISRTTGRAIYLPPVETDDPHCPIHGIAGRKLMRRLNRSYDDVRKAIG